MVQELPPEMIYKIFDAIPDEDFVIHSWIEDMFYLNRRKKRSFGCAPECGFDELYSAVHGDANWTSRAVWSLINESSTLSYIMFDRLCVGLQDPLDSFRFISKTTNRASILLDAAAVVVDHPDDKGYLDSFLSIFFHDSTQLGHGKDELEAFKIIVDAFPITISYTLTAFLQYTGMSAHSVEYMNMWVIKNDELYCHLNGISLLIPYLILDIQPIHLDRDTYYYLYDFDFDEEFDDFMFNDSDVEEMEDNINEVPPGDPADGIRQLFTMLLVISSRRM